MRHRRVRIGGPAVDLMPRYLEGCGAEIGGDYPGVLQRFNHLATRTSLGCPRKCNFCAVPKVAAARARELSGKPVMPLPDWPDLPVIADDNLPLHMLAGKCCGLRSSSFVARREIAPQPSATDKPERFRAISFFLFQIQSEPWSTPFRERVVMRGMSMCGRYLRLINAQKST